MPARQTTPAFRPSTNLRDSGAGRLTRAAVRYAVHLNRLGTPRHLQAQALYEFNRLPLARLRLALPDYAGSPALADAVQAEVGDAFPARYVRQVNEAARWLYWIAPDGFPNARLRHKLYVSPAPAALPATLAAVMRACGTIAPPSFKLGLDAHGILRADKLVVYFTDPDMRRAYVAALRPLLDGLEAHGTPLARPVGEDGFLATAEDPMFGELSWRQLVSAEIVDTLAVAGDAARRAPVEETVEAVFAGLARRGLSASLIPEPILPERCP